jgi:hypothetical protein
MKKATMSGKQWRWIALLAVAAVILLVRLFSSDGLEGKNPVLLGILLVGAWIVYRLSKKNIDR